jgi:hypothetical protein
LGAPDCQSSVKSPVALPHSVPGAEARSGVRPAPRT